MNKMNYTTLSTNDTITVFWNITSSVANEIPLIVLPPWFYKIFYIIVGFFVTTVLLDNLTRVDLEKINNPKPIYYIEAETPSTPLTRYIDEQEQDYRLFELLIRVLIGGLFIYLFKLLGEL